MFKSRAFNSFELDPVTNIVTKRSRNEKLKDEYDYLISLPNKLSIFFPRVIDYGKDESGYFIKMENYAYKSLGEIMVNEVFELEIWNKIYNSINAMYEWFSFFDKAEENKYFLLKSMYIDKTENEIQKVKNSNQRFQKIISHKEIEINGIQYLNFFQIWDEIKLYIEKNLLKNKRFTAIHGDFCFSNILCGFDQKNQSAIIRLIDPRGSFGVKGIYGDTLYDLAKLRHSFEGGYEYIIYDNFQLSFNSELNNFQYKFSNDNLDKIKEVFKKYTQNINSQLVEGLLFISMGSRHFDNIERQTLMYIIGVKLLNDFRREVYGSNCINGR